MSAPILHHDTRHPFPVAGLDQPRPATLSANRTTPGQLWEREAEREVSYYQTNGYRYTNQLTLTRSILINLRLSMQALGIEDKKPADLSRHMLNQGYRQFLTVTRYDDVTGEPYYEENEAD